MKLDVTKQTIDYAQMDIFRMPQTSTTTTGTTATCRATLGVVAASSRNISAGTEETQTITNALAATGDACFATVIAKTGGTPGVVSAITSSGAIAITVSNYHGSEATTAYTIAFLLVKAA